MNLKNKFSIEFLFGEGQLLVKLVILKGRVDFSPPLPALHQGILRGMGNTSLWTFPALSCIMQFTTVKGVYFQPLHMPFTSRACSAVDPQVGCELS
jgi:hypothetical protein